MKDRIYKISQLEPGIGDLLMSMYGIYAFCVQNDFPHVQLFVTNHIGWLNLLDIPNLEVLLYEGGQVDYELGDTLELAHQRWRENYDTKEWYAHKLGVKPLKPPIHRRVFDSPIEFPPPYVVFSPFASRANRTWEIQNWRILAKKLTLQGYWCIVIDSLDQKERCQLMGLPVYYGSPEWVARTCTHAALVIGNDSGIAHLSALLNIPTIVVMAMMDPRAYYSLSNHTAIIPQDIPCIGCRLQPSRGYEEKCNTGCWALQSISPNRVFDEAMKLLEAK